MAQLSWNWPIITSDWWLELISKSLTMVELRVEWVMVGGEKPGPASHQPPHIRGWPSRGTGRRRTGPRWETEGVVFCVLPSVVLRSWPGEEAGVRGQGWPDGWPGDMRRGVSVVCSVCGDTEPAALLSWIIENVFTSRVGTLVCELARYILSLCIIARQLNSILQNIITFSDTQIGGQNLNRRSKIVR